MSAIALVVCATTARADETGSDRVHHATHGEPVENGKTLDMRFDEVERAADASIIEVAFRSGGSVSSSLFVMRGMCAVTRARGESFFIAAWVDGDRNRYRVTFPKEQGDATLELPRREGRPVRRIPEVMSLAQCRRVGF